MYGSFTGQRSVGCVRNQMTKDSPKDRIFTSEQKRQCWDQSTLVPGRDPARWRADPVGNVVFREFRGCMGPLCHEYDHIVPYSKLLLAHTHTHTHTVLHTARTLFF